VNIGESEFPLIEPSRRKPLDAWLNALFWAIALCTLLISCWAHRLAGFTFPNPWNDEPWMLWGAIFFLQHNTPFSDFINLERPVFAFPAYGTALGLLFKATGVSFSLARWTSWVGTMLAYLALLRIVRRHPFPRIAAGTVSLFFLGSAAVIAGNMVRPEAVVLMLAAVSFSLLTDRKDWKGLALSACCGIFHIAGLFFFLAAFGTVVARALRLHRFPPRPRLTDWLFIAAIATLILLHGAVILTHWDVYLLDTLTNVQVDNPSNAVGRLLFSPMTPWYAMAAGLALFFFWRNPDHLPWIAFGGACLLIPAFRLQMWYDIYRQMGLMMMTLTIPLLAWEIST
jgi:hypothetical protein